MSAVPSQAYQRTVENQKAAADPARSVWVSANAGSGKTKVLTDRVTRLLLEGTSPDRILSLTFTKAAAAEMTNRLFNKLGEWVTLPDTDLKEAVEELTGEDWQGRSLAPARRLFAQALETPGGLKIQTIHAFCQSLLMRFPLEAGLPANFQVADDQTTADMLKLAQARLLELLDSGDKSESATIVRELMKDISEGGLLGLADEVNRARSEIHKALMLHKWPSGIAEAIRVRLGLEQDESREQAVDSFFEFAQADEGLKQMLEVLSVGAKTEQAAAEAMRAGLFKGAEDYDAYRLAFLTKTNGTPKSRFPTKKTLEAHGWLEEVVRAETDRVLEMDEFLRKLDLYEHSLQMVHFADLILGFFDGLKRSQGLVDYDDLIDYTANLLHDRDAASWVLYKLDGGIDHILVDEAQDTSPAQWEVIQAFTEEFFAGEGVHEERSEKLRTLFVVGDEKQSIYSFQGADPAEFYRLRVHFKDRIEAAKHHFSDLGLILSFRSTSEVLSSVDTVFEKEEIAAGVSFSGDPITHEAFRVGVSGCVEIWPTIKPEEKQDVEAWDDPLDKVSLRDPKAVLANKIADQIAEWLKKGEPSAPGRKAMAPGDILILVQRRNAFVDEMVRALKQREIPVAGRDRMVLTDQMAVMDLMAIADFALLPEDDLTLATVLKTPIIGFTEEALFELAHGRHGSLWHALSMSQAPEAKAAYRYLQSVLARVDVAPPYEFFASLLVGLTPSGGSGRERLLARLGHEAADPIDEFLNMVLTYEQQETPTLQGFLSWIRLAASEIRRDMEHGANEVRIMTVHGSKGLEAPVVFLPDTCAGGSAGRDPYILNWKSEAAPDLPLWRVGAMQDEDSVTRDLRAELQAQRDEERRRLLYVAMTRAEDRLYIAGYETSKGRPDDCWYNLIEASLFDKTEEVERFDGEKVQRMGATPDPADAVAPEAMEKATPQQDVPEWLTQQAPEEGAREQAIAPSRLMAEEEEADALGPALSPLQPDDRARFRRGNLIHRMLELLPDVAIVRRAEVADRFLERQAPDLEPGEREALVSETLTVIENSNWAVLFSADSQAEISVSGRIGKDGPLLNGQIDRLSVTEKEVLIIDYKTNRPPPKTADKVDPLYVRQMAAYRALMSDIYPGKNIRCLLLWTDGPWVTEIAPKALDDALKDAITQR